MKSDLHVLRANLSFAYRLMVASVPLLQFAIPKAQGSLLEYYKRHLEEESGHDEMLKRDLANLGVVEVPHFYDAAQLAGAQYYLIAHEHPAMLLGYMHALESGTMRVELVDQLSRDHGAELTALRHHAIHDPGHKVDLEEMISSLGEELRSRVLWNEENVKRRLSEIRP